MELMPPTPDYASLFALQRQSGPVSRDPMREACEEAEGLFASILLKEGLEPLFSEADESGSHMRGLLELTVEQMARDMGAQGTLGIADQFYEQLSGQEIFALPKSPATPDGAAR